MPPALLALLALVALSCTSDDDAPRADDEAPDAVALADQLGCDRTAPRLKTGWDDEPPVACFVDDGWAATIHAPLAAGSRESGLQLLRARYDSGRDFVPCPDGTTFDDVSVIADDTWIVVVSNDHGADQVLDRLGGTLQPADGPGPPISYFTLPCP